MHDAPVATDCPNCGAALAVDPHPRFCPLCGQETRLHPPSFGDFVHEFVSHYVALEGTIWRTLGVLLFRPGQLTLEYLAGRRRRYVPPLRVYLSASFLFFLVVGLLGVGTGLALQVDPQPGSRPVIALDSGEATELQTRIARCATPGACGWTETRLTRAAATLWGKDGASAVGQRMASAAPYAVFLMLPVFAGLLRLAWRRQGMPYGAHFVFGLHAHAVAFLVLLAFAPLPDHAGDWAVPLIFGHGVLAMRRVYATGWPATLARAAAVGLAYSLALVVGTLVLTAGAVLLSSGT